MKIRSSFAVWCVLFGLFGVSTVRSHAQSRCLWLNAATAGGVLGGDVEMTVTPLTILGDETCEFTRAEGTFTSMLRIEVHSVKAPAQDFASLISKCGGGSLPLKRIGNEAVQCRAAGRAHTGDEQVIGRVRERIFTLTLRRKPTSNAGAESLSEDAQNIAEQIAGSLF